MNRLIIVCGPTGAGKTTYSVALADEINAVRFSIDPWMQTLFAKDMTELSYDWMIERVERCQAQMWDVARQILTLKGNVILDLGFTEKSQRDHFKTLAGGLNITPEVHYLNAPASTRKHTTPTGRKTQRRKRPNRLRVRCNR